MAAAVSAMLVQPAAVFKGGQHRLGSLQAFRAVSGWRESCYSVGRPFPTLKAQGLSLAPVEESDCGRWRARGGWVALLVGPRLVALSGPTCAD